MGDVESLQRLLKAKASDINEKDADGLTPLHIAVTAGHFNAVSLLLDAQADATARNDQLNTPLHLAAMHGHTRILQHLIDRTKGKAELSKTVHSQLS